MGRYAVIGLGNFGFHVAHTLFQLGKEVVGIDQDPEKVQRAQPHCSYVMQGDGGNKEFLAQQGVHELDAAIVSTGDRSHLATLITLHLSELGIKKILVKAVDEDHGHILSKVGATDVIYPEKDMAIRTARSLASPTFLEALPLMEDHTLLESAPPADFVGKTLLDLNLRNRFEVSVIAIRDVLTGVTQIMPPADRVLKDSDLMVLLGKTEGIDRLSRM